MRDVAKGVMLSFRVPYAVARSIDESAARAGLKRSDWLRETISSAIGDPQTQEDPVTKQDGDGASPEAPEPLDAEQTLDHDAVSPHGTDAEPVDESESLLSAVTLAEPAEVPTRQQEDDPSGGVSVSLAAGGSPTPGGGLDNGERSPVEEGAEVDGPAPGTTTPTTKEKIPWLR